MVTTYQPKNSYFTPERVQKSIKDLITTCYKDREQMLLHYDYSMDAFKKDTENREDCKAFRHGIKKL